MAKNSQNDATDSVEIIESGLSKSEKFIESNQKTLTVILVVVLAIIGGYYLYHNYVSTPKEFEAQQQSWPAVIYFEKDSFALALDGDGNNPGFLEIIDEYGSTAVGNQANYYAGICLLRQGEFEDAIEYLDKFSSDDKFVGTIALAAIGDAYVELNDYENALSYYDKASKRYPNDFMTPAVLMKAGQVYEEMKNFQKAYDTYELIKKEYPESNEVSSGNIEKYITRAKIKSNG